MASGEDVTSLLRDAIGLDPEVLGPASVESAVALRRAALGLAAVEPYAPRLASPTELAALIDEVVVPETWFFRDPAAFALLAGFARERHEAPARRRGTRRLRVLCVPCSSGEEACSIAMALLDAGLPSSSFEIRAVDVSARLVAAAERGIYGPRSVRGAVPAAHHVRTREAGELEVVERVRDTIRFTVANVLAPDFLDSDESRGPYDAIFCRNLLIYLTRDARRVCLARLERMLAADGLLFVGHAEVLSVLDPRFAPSGPGDAFAYVRKAGARR